MNIDMGISMNMSITIIRNMSIGISMNIRVWGLLCTWTLQCSSFLVFVLFFS